MEKASPISLELPYPLLLAWVTRNLKQIWERERNTLIENCSQLSPGRAGELIAAKLAVLLSEEYERLQNEVRQQAQTAHQRDEYMGFYDALQEDDLPSYRRMLQDISGTRTLLLDEQDYREQRE